MSYSVTIKTTTKEKLSYKTDTPPCYDPNVQAYVIYDNDHGNLKFNRESVVSISVRPLDEKSIAVVGGKIEEKSANIFESPEIEVVGSHYPQINVVGGSEAE